MKIEDVLAMLRKRRENYYDDAPEAVELDQTIRVISAIIPMRNALFAAERGLAEAMQQHLVPGLRNEYEMVKAAIDLLPPKMTVAERIHESIRYLGGGMYESLTPVLTRAGLLAGWSFRYPLFYRGDKPLSETGETLDSLLAAGHIVLEKHNHARV